MTDANDLHRSLGILLAAIEEYTHWNSQAAFAFLTAAHSDAKEEFQKYEHAKKEQ